VGRGEQRNSRVRGQEQASLLGDADTAESWPAATMPPPPPPRNPHTTAHRFTREPRGARCCFHRFAERPSSRASRLPCRCPPRPPDLQRFRCSSSSRQRKRSGWKGMMGKKGRERGTSREKRRDTQPRVAELGSLSIEPLSRASSTAHVLLSAVEAVDGDRVKVLVRGQSLVEICEQRQGRRAAPRERHASETLP